MSVPRGFHVIGRTRGWFGSAVFSTRQDPPTFLVKASGYVGLRILEQDRALLSEFAKIHPEGFECVVDARDVVLPNPLNVLWIAWIKGRPAVRRYVVVCTSPLLRMLIMVASPVVAPDAIRKRVVLNGARSRAAPSRSRVSH